MQRIERKHLTLRTRIKRLARKTICFSKSIVMHDLVSGLFINKFVKNFYKKLTFAQKRRRNFEKIPENAQFAL